MKIVLGVLGLVALGVLWRIYATIAGGRRAYRTLLAQIAPITQALAAGRDPTEADLVAFASDRRTRRVLYDVLDHQSKLHLFPRQHLTWEAMAEADLAAWLNHPNELGSPPDEMELVTRVRAPGADTHYFVFRFRMSPPHWAAKDGWLAGVAGPYDLSQEPRPYAAGTFSRFESFDSRTPQQHVEMIDRATSGRPARGLRRARDRHLTLCDSCKERDAVVHVTQIQGGDVKRLNLCEKCAAERGVDETTVAVPKHPLGGR